MNAVTIRGNRITAWSVSRRTFWVQTDCPAIARRLTRRRNSRLVAVSVGRAYLRIFELLGSRRLLRRIVTRSGRVATDQFSKKGGAATRLNPPNRVITSSHGDERTSRGHDSESRQAVESSATQ